MTREIINTGGTANDGSGDTLRGFATKSNNNFTEIYSLIGGDSSDLVGNVNFGNNQVVFQGTNLTDSLKTVLTVTAATQLNTINLPDSSGEVITTTAVQDLHRKTFKNTIIEGRLALAGASGTGHYLLNFLSSVDSADPDRNVNIPAIADSDTLVFEAHAQTLTNKTLTSAILTTPRLSSSINDTNGAELIKVTATGSAANEVTIANAAASGKPTITASGTDTDITMKLSGKGTGAVELAKAAYSASTITANGAANTDVTLIICNKSTALAVSLADGTTVGEYKIFTNKGAGAATVTPANFAQGTSFALAQHDGCQCVWDGANWFLVGNQGEITIA